MKYLAQNYKKEKPLHWNMRIFRFYVSDRPVQFIEHTTQVMVINEKT